MPLKLRKVTTEAEFSRVCAVETEAFMDPFFGFWQVFYGTGSQENFCSRQWSWHKDDPSSNWLYVEDEETGNVIAGAQWNIYEKNPYAKESEMLTLYWVPESDFNDVASQLLKGFLSYRLTRMNEPHILLNFCFTHPRHRRRGAGRMLMEWGINKADELGLSSYIEATDIGLQLYEACGFKVEGNLDLDATKENPSEGFIKLREKLGCPIHGWFMCRPANSKK